MQIQYQQLSLKTDKQAFARMTWVSCCRGIRTACQAVVQLEPSYLFRLT
jgi:hypothetical protein